MDTSVPIWRDLCTPKSKTIKARLKKRTLQSAPTRNRKCYDPQRRLEVAETRKNGACARCREKKLRCTPAQHKSSARGSPESTNDILSNSSKSPPDRALTVTNNGSTVLKIDDCVQTAKGYLRAAQIHVEELARFIEALESSNEASSRNRFSNDDVNILEKYSRTMTRSSSHQSIGSLFNEENMYSSNPHANETNDFRKGLSNLGLKTYIYKDQAIISPISIEPTNGKTTMLDFKDRNRVLRPKSDLVEQATEPPAKGKASRSEMKRWRPSLTGENEPWAAFTPLNTPKFPRKTWKSNSPDNLDEKLVQRKHGPEAPEQIRPESTEYCPSTSSRNGARSFSTLEKIFPKLSRGESPGMFFALGNNLLPDQGPATKRSGQSFQDLPRFNGLDDDFEMYGNAMGSGFDQQIPQVLDDSFFLSVQDSESVITQTASEYITAWDATLYPPQVHLPSSNMHNSLFIDEECCRSPPRSSGQSSDAAPWTILSRDTDPLALQSSPYTPTSRGPQKLRELGMLEGQNKLLDIDWSLQGFD